jgi:hypothetical protein
MKGTSRAATVYKIGVPAVKFFHHATGQADYRNVMLNYCEPIAPDEAIEKYREGAIVFVAREDAPRVAAEFGIPFKP